jgi:hypothetical protein
MAFKKPQNNNINNQEIQSRNVYLGNLKMLKRSPSYLVLRKIRKKKFKLSNAYRDRKTGILFSQKKLENFIGAQNIDDSQFSSTYKSLKKWRRRILFYSRAFKKITIFSLKFAGRATFLGLILSILYSLSPFALSAPESVTVTMRNEWEKGEMTSVQTFGTSAATDAIQLKADGTWTARTWDTPPDAISTGHSSVMAGDYLYVFRGYSDKAFWRYSTLEDSWEILPDLPQPAYYGADLSYDGSANLYMIFGGYSKKFYRYNISDETFTELREIPDTPWQGASIETDGTDFFVTRGGGTDGLFWRYDVGDNLWNSLAPVTGAPGAGSDLVNGQDGYLYLVQGAGTTNFYRYNLTSRLWENRTSLPATCGGNCTMGNDQRGTYWNGYIYYLRSNGTLQLMRYYISGNSWENITTDPAPAAPNFASLALNSTDGNIYAIRGNGSFDLWKYDPDAAAGFRWLGPQKVNNETNSTLGTGSDLIWNGQSGATNYIYVIRGGGQNYFYRYNVATNDYTAMSTTNFYASPNYDMKGTFVSAPSSLYYPRYNSTSIYAFDGSAWSTTTATLPAVAYDGAVMAYNSGNNRIYTTRGSGTQTLYGINTANLGVGGTWPTMANMAVTDGGTTINYFGNVGTRMISNGTNLYIMPGGGETAFLRYNTGTNNYTRLSPTPFAQYYGSDMTYNGLGKIIAMAGYYKDETWEYDIATDVWRRLPNNLKLTYGRGPYQGASIEYNGGTSSFYATTGQGSSDVWSYTAGTAKYKLSGTYQSESLDLEQVASWTSFTKNDNTPLNTILTYETRTSADNQNWSSWEAVSGTDIQSPENRYIQVRITLGSTAGADTPTVYDYTISYNSEDTDPTNPTSVTATTQQIGGSPMVSGNDYDTDHPFFNWPEPGEAGGAVETGAGVAGYYVYLGNSNSADPESQGSFVTTSQYVANETLNQNTYYLRIKTKDNNGNVSDTAWAAFTYNYEGVYPPLSETKTTQANFEAGIRTNISTTAVANSMRLNNVSGFWNQARLSMMSGTNYFQYGADMAVSTCRGSANHCIYALRGNNAGTFYRYEIETDTWSGSPTVTDLTVSVYYGGEIVAGPAGYLYALQGGGTSSAFYRYDIANNTWTAIDSIPRAVTYGSGMSYDGSRYIYALPGNDDAFYRYDTCNGQGTCTPGWTQLSNTEFGNPNESDGQKTYEGSDLAFDGNGNLYALQGNYYPYFSKYNINSGTWTPMAQAPVGPYDGGNLAYDSSENKIYMISGKSRLNFFSYDIATDEWSAELDTPAGMGAGACLLNYSGYIYALRGSGTMNFYRFSVAEKTWQLPTFGFFGPHEWGSGYFTYYNGAFMVDDDNDDLYIIRGYYDNVFGKYETDTGTFTPLANLPVGAYNGASMAYAGDEGYIYFNPGNIPTTRTGTLNNYFYRYQISTNTWTEITTDRPPGQTYAGSSMAYDGSRYLYLTQGNNALTWWRYDTEGTVGSRWTTIAATGPNWQDGSKLAFVENGATDYIFAARGNGNTTNWRYTIGGAWTALGALPAGVSTGSSMTYGGDGYVYCARGNNTNDHYRYNIAQATPGSWENLTAATAKVPAQVFYGGVSTTTSNRNWQIAGAGTNTYADGLYSYLIGSSSGATGFEKTGSYESEAIDLTSVYHWANLTINYTIPENTFLTIETNTSENGTDWSGWTAASNDHVFGNTHVLNINSAAEKFIKLRLSFSSSNQIFSPRVDDFTINYYQDMTLPENPTATTGYSTGGKLQIINSGTFYGHTAPYFEWPAEGEIGGAVDNVGGSGIAGYYVYFGTNPAGDPTTLQTNNYYQASGLATGETYYLRIQAVDNSGMMDADIYDAFTYRFDNTAPTNPTDINVNPTGYTSIDDFDFTWEADAADAHSGIDKFQYRTGADDPITGWIDIDNPGAITVTIPNGDHIEGAYQSGKNTFYLRVVDNAGNTSAAISQDYYFAATAPTPPRNLTVTPDIPSTSNSFYFEWDTPESFIGEESKLKYYYSINAMPTQYNTTMTTVKTLGPGPFATQYGTNTLYVVAMDEANNIDYNLYNSIPFTANTTAPGIPLNTASFDTSDRETEEYSVAVKWSQPTSYDSGNFAGYVIYRSLDNVTFTEVATTTGMAFVDTDLESRLYYYYVKSKDKTNNYSAASTTVSLTPTGRYTRPPTVVQETSVEIQSFQATFNWATSRVCSSFIEYGKTMSLGETTGQVDSVTDHEVIVKGLTAGTKYYYRAKFIDPDGNIGTSDVANFETLPPPTISEVTIGEVGLTNATISWDTNTSATCIVKYGKRGTYSVTMEETSSGSTHVHKIETLESNTEYNVLVDCTDADLNNFSSDEYFFSTLRQPVVSEPQVDNKENVDLPTVTVYYKTDELTTTLVKFKTGDESDYHNYLTSEKVLEHRADIEGLDPSKEYTFILTGVSESGVEALSQEIKITTRSDSRPPELLTNRAIGKVNGRGKDAQAVIYIKIETNELTKVKINFSKGVIASNFEQNTPEDGDNTYHLITIPVEAGQIYSYQVEANDQARNTTLTQPNTIVVENKKENAAEIVTNTFSKQFGWLSSIWGK